MTDKFYVYTITSVESGEVLYVGKGSGYRWKTSLKRIEELSGSQCEVFLEEASTDELALQKETKLIRSLSPVHNKRVSWRKIKTGSSLAKLSITVPFEFDLVSITKTHAGFNYDLVQVGDPKMNCMYVKGKKNPNKYLWARFGDKEKPGVECSSRGYKHYSAIYALMPDGRSIEAHYQCDVKGYNPGGVNWQMFKRKSPKNPETKLWEEYLKLWEIWAANNPERIEYLVKLADHAGGFLLTDQFATTPVNQARALAHILNTRIG